MLQDGTNTYLYGAGRVAQYGASGAEYYLGDALGSVRQMVDASGNVTLGRNYKPYGGVLSSMGGGATSYGFTNEWTDASTGDVYLRARWYAPGQGRFLTRDTWEGDYMRPMSINMWNYVQSNPINYLDPTGNARTRCAFLGGFSPPEVVSRVDEAEKYVLRVANDEMSTYVAAGIAIQCAGTDIPKDAWSSMGIAQVSYPQAARLWEKAVKDRWGDIRSYGLCPQEELGKPLDPNDPEDAVILMKRKIQQVTAYCQNCSATDIFIAAGLAQNGSGFSYKDMQYVDKRGLSSLNKVKYNNPNVAKDWFYYFDHRYETDHSQKDTRQQLERFYTIIKVLMNRNWSIPSSTDFEAIEILSKWRLKSGGPIR